MTDDTPDDGVLEEVNELLRNEFIFKDWSWSLFIDPRPIFQV